MAFAERREEDGGLGNKPPQNPSQAPLGSDAKYLAKGLLSFRADIADNNLEQTRKTIAALKAYFKADAALYSLLGKLEAEARPALPDLADYSKYGYMATLFYCTIIGKELEYNVGAKKTGYAASDIAEMRTALETLGTSNRYASDQLEALSGLEADLKAGKKVDATSAANEINRANYSTIENGLAQMQSLENLATASYFADNFQVYSPFGSKYTRFVAEDIRYHPPENERSVLAGDSERIGTPLDMDAVPANIAKCASEYFTGVSKGVLASYKKMSESNSDAEANDLIRSLKARADELAHESERLGTSDSDRLAAVGLLVKFKNENCAKTLAKIDERKYWNAVYNDSENDTLKRVLFYAQKHGATAQIWLAFGIAALNPAMGRLAFGYMGVRDAVKGTGSMVQQGINEQNTQELLFGLSMLAGFSANSVARLSGTAYMNTSIALSAAKTISDALDTKFTPADIESLGNNLVFVLGYAQSQVARERSAKRAAAMASERDAQAPAAGKRKSDASGLVRALEKVGHYKNEAELLESQGRYQEAFLSRLRCKTEAWLAMESYRKKNGDGNAPELGKIEEEYSRQLKITGTAEWHEAQQRLIYGTYYRYVERLANSLLEKGSIGEGISALKTAKKMAENPVEKNRIEDEIGQVRGGGRQMQPLQNEADLVAAGMQLATGSTHGKNLRFSMQTGERPVAAALPKTRAFEGMDGQPWFESMKEKFPPGLHHIIDQAWENSTKGRQAVEALWDAYNNPRKGKTPTEEVEQKWNHLQQIREYAKNLYITKHRENYPEGSVRDAEEYLAKHARKKSEDGLSNNKRWQMKTDDASKRLSELKGLLPESLKYVVEEAMDIFAESTIVAAKNAGKVLETYLRYAKDYGEGGQGAAENKADAWWRKKKSDTAALRKYMDREREGRPGGERSSLLDEGGKTGADGNSTSGLAAYHKEFEGALQKIRPEVEAAYGADSKGARIAMDDLFNAYVGNRMAGETPERALAAVARDWARTKRILETPDEPEAEGRPARKKRLDLIEKSHEAYVPGDGVLLSREGSSQEKSLSTRTRSSEKRTPVGGEPVNGEAGKEAEQPHDYRKSYAKMLRDVYARGGAEAVANAIGTVRFGKKEDVVPSLELVESELGKPVRDLVEGRVAPIAKAEAEKTAETERQNELNENYSGLLLAVIFVHGKNAGRAAEVVGQIRKAYSETTGTPAWDSYAKELQEKYFEEFRKKVQESNREALAVAEKGEAKGSQEKARLRAEFDGRFADAIAAAKNADGQMAKSGKSVAETAIDAVFRQYMLFRTRQGMGQEEAAGKIISDWGFSVEALAAADLPAGTGKEAHNRIRKRDGPKKQEMPPAKMNKEQREFVNKAKKVLENYEQSGKKLTARNIEIDGNTLGKFNEILRLDKEVKAKIREASGANRKNLGGSAAANAVLTRMIDAEFDMLADILEGKGKLDEPINHNEPTWRAGMDAARESFHQAVGRIASEIKSQTVGMRQTREGREEAEGAVEGMVRGIRHEFEIEIAANASERAAIPNIARLAGQAVTYEEILSLCHQSSIDLLFNVLRSYDTANFQALYSQVGGLGVKSPDFVRTMNEITKRGKASLVIQDGSILEITQRRHGDDVIKVTIIAETGGMYQVNYFTPYAMHEVETMHLQNCFYDEKSHRASGNFLVETGENLPARILDLLWKIPDKDEFYDPAGKKVIVRSSGKPSELQPSQEFSAPQKPAANPTALGKLREGMTRLFTLERQANEKPRPKELQQETELELAWYMRELAQPEAKAMVDGPLRDFFYGNAARLEKAVDEKLGRGTFALMIADERPTKSLEILLERIGKVPGLQVRAYNPDVADNFWVKEEVAR